MVREQYWGGAYGCAVTNPASGAALDGRDALTVGSRRPVRVRDESQDCEGSPDRGAFRQAIEKLQEYWVRFAKIPLDCNLALLTP